MRRTTGMVCGLALAVAVILPSGGASAISGIQVSKTISTNGTCGPSSNPLNVISGTDVTYCYTVTNNDSCPITVTAIQDDQLGAIGGVPLNGLPAGSAHTFTMTDMGANTDITNTVVVTANNSSCGSSTFTRTDTAVLTICGDGDLDPGEACDDGNNVSGDGCTADCTAIEEGFTCPTPGTLCDDGDGIDPPTEDGVNADNDGNDDGIPDRQQPAVTSLPSATGRGYLTLVTGDGTVTNGCHNTLVAAFLETDLGTDLMNDYPFGLLGFTLPAPCVGPIKITIIYHSHPGPLTTPTYRKFGQEPPYTGAAGTNHFYSLPSAMFGTTTVDGTALASVMFVLRDGKLGDDVGPTTGDGMIIDQGGPAFAAGAAPVASTWGLIGMSLLLAAVAFVTLRRRTA
ncbi:MAG: hypothetical protein HYR72_09715 [Deltaproteobacteria bacterium]|nr:hypothetical protein [Deltaproteobacteria bacterium]MBI3387976.1 hypothetical protein [Deltaproteobacteria bacterium]